MGLVFYNIEAKEYVKNLKIMEIADHQFRQMVNVPDESY